MATNRSQWLKVHSRWFKNYISAKKCILITFWIVNIAFNIPLHFIINYCAIFNSLNAGFFPIPSGCNSLDPNQARNFVEPDLGPNCLQRLSADDKSRRSSGQRVKYRTTC